MAAIIIGVVVASMLLWFGPQGEPNVTNIGQNVTADNINRFRSDEALGSIYSRHQNLVAEVDFDYDRWKRGDVDSSRMLGTISDAKTETAEMREAFDAAEPPEQWQASFDYYAEALGSFSSYLDEMERIVRAGDKNPDETTLGEYRQNSDEQLQLALDAIPVDPLNSI